MKQVKKIVGLALAMALLCHSTSTVYAVTHAADCMTSSTIVVCGQQVATESIGGHLVRDEAGNNVMCTRTRIRRLHDIKCAYINCRVTLVEDEQRVCTVTHSYCNNETGQCQY